VTQVQAPPSARRRLGWAALLTFDAAVGYLAAWPLYLIGSGLTHGITVPLGFHDRGFWWGEGARAAVGTGIIFLVPILLVLVAVNEPLRRRMRLPARRHWPIVAALLVLPLLVGYLSSILLR
jgi:hypothetical protein